MSQDKRNIGRKDKTHFDIRIDQICTLLHFIWIAAGALLVVAVLGISLFSPSKDSAVAYQLTIIFCGITAIGGWFACRALEKKDRELKERETVLKSKSK